MLKIASAIAAAVTALGLVATTSAAASPKWLTEPSALLWAEGHGVVFSDGVGRPINGFCHGTGTRRGTLYPLFQRFRCTLVFNTGAGTAWYDVLVRTPTVGYRLVVLKVFARH